MPFDFLDLYFLSLISLIYSMETNNYICFVLGFVFFFVSDIFDKKLGKFLNNWKSTVLNLRSYVTCVILVREREREIILTQSHSRCHS